MVISNGHSMTIPHRPNRRRERPGSRTRRTMPRKVSSQYEFHEGVLDARDNNLRLPSDRARPSPASLQNYDQNWQRWQMREAEAKAFTELRRMRAKQEWMFGGDDGDDELYSLGILYNTDEDIVQDSESTTVLCDVPLEASLPAFTLRHGKPKRSRRQHHSYNLPLHLSFTGLSDDREIARLLSPPISHKGTIQHRHISFSVPIVANIPQSLPTSSALKSFILSSSVTLPDSTIPSQPLDQRAGDWEVVDRPHSATPTLVSESETWILVDDL